MKDSPRDFLAATGLTLEEFHKLLPACRAASETRYPPERTREGKARRRHPGGGAKGALPNCANNLLFILVYQKTNPLQPMQALQFKLSQPQGNFWIQQWLPVLQPARGDSGGAPERDASRVAPSQVVRAGAPDFTLDGTERRRPRPADKALQKEQYSGTQKTHTDKNILLVHENPGNVV